MSDPLRSLADAARAVTAAATVDDVLEIVADAARDVIGARHGVARRGAERGAARPPARRAAGRARRLEPRPDRAVGQERRVHRRRRGDRHPAGADGGERDRDARAAQPRARGARRGRGDRPPAAAREAARGGAAERGRAIAGRLELQEIVQLATDSARELTPASFGAFFYNVISDAGEAYMLYTLSGVERSAFERFPMPRNTAIFAAHVQRRGDRPARRRAGRLALRPQRALPRDARGPPARSAATSRCR